MLISALIIVLIGIGFLWNYRPRRGHEPGFKFVYVNQDGTVRELSPGEVAYLSEDFLGGDSGRPYIKGSYENSDGWGSQSGFIERRRIPAQIKILPVHPNYDAREKEFSLDLLACNRAAGDIIVTNPDGSITCTPNPKLSGRERFELSRNYMLADQRRREALAKVNNELSSEITPVNDSGVVTPNA